ncbi:restriction endonuclease subunit S [Halomonas denitrificans]|uniref:restriction endonuclease subunit S n=1 Tax=Halomonas denitrificans TaxID=370769 RepID=UPI000DF31FC2|nr:restriction endonuclease subunit S [Halomonas denitrificans]
MSVRELITDHLDLWTGAVTHKSSAGRGNNGKVELTGIKKLRELILELAVRGKLVEQDPNDEPASVLLERITEEKARLVKEGQIKKPKKLPKVSLEELPAPVPVGWEAVTLSHLGVFCGGKTPSKSKSEFWDGDIPWVTPKDMKMAEVTNTEDHVTHSATMTGGLELLPEDTVLFVVRSGILRRMFPTAISRESCTINQDLKALKLYMPEMARYVQILSWGFERFILESLTKTGTTVESLKFNEFSVQPFPFPPLSEQKRIVDKVDELMTLCDRLEQQVGDQLEAHEVVVDTLLDALTHSADAAELGENWVRIAEHFDTLFTTEASIDKLKQTILQLAVMGRLVPQDPNDEPVPGMLEKLPELPKPARYKKRSNEVIAGNFGLSINHPGLPVPNGWEWVPLVSIARLESGHTPSRNHAEWWGGSIPWIGIKDARASNDGVIYETIQTINEQGLENSAARLLPAGTVCFSRTASVGYVVIMGKAMATSQDFVNWVPSDAISSNWLRLVLIAERPAMGRFSKGAVHQTIYYPAWLAMHIALPPLEEQKRIVEKADELMALCDELKVRLGEAGGTRAQLAEAVVEQAVL